MKKIITIIAVITALATTDSIAQGLYVGVGYGYGFRAGGVILGSDNNADGSSQVVRGSYGAGMVPNLSIGYFFTENIGTEVNFGYLIGTPTRVEDQAGNNRGHTDYSASSFFINPSMVFRGGGDGKIIPYGKIGLFLGVANAGKRLTDSDQFNGAGDRISTNDNQVDLKGGVSTGLTSALGLDFMLTDNFAIFGELTGRLASWSPASYTSTTITNTYPGGLNTATSSVSGNFQDTTPANYTGTNTPSQILPLSAIGFNVGIRYYLW